ncbi:MAG: hypothetical protein KAG84_04635 [Bacteroidales bacterium]|nr:hypothetical protein [Bacteroidales bacterium]
MYLSIFLRRVFIAVFLLVLVQQISAQGDFSWWNEKHDWHQGDEPWFRQMNTSAAYFGPNALPVPDMREGLISPLFKVEFRPEMHLSKGDNTYNLYTSLQIPFKGIASFEMFLVPIEYYSMDTITRDERMARSYDPTGTAGGDFWFGTNFQVVKGMKYFPDIIASFYFKTASGTNLSNARYTDTPGYYALINMGKNIISNKKIALRAFGNIGSYIWQTQSNTNSQNDAIAYGLGISAKYDMYLLRAIYTGYYGYLNIGDRPSVFRLQVGTEKEGFNWQLRYQIGIHNFDYNSFGISLLYKWSAGY